MPSLLVKKSFIKDCFNEEENLEKGGDYPKSSFYNCDKYKKFFGAKRIHRRVKERLDLNNDFFNFLKYGGYSINNIAPININSNEANAKFEIKLENNLLNKYSYMQIVLLDEKSISTNLICLCEDNDKFKIETKNITNPQSLDCSKNFTEINKIELIRAGNKFNINESSSYTLIDSINKLSKFYLLKSDKDSSNINEEDWEKFKFIFSLDNFNEKEFIDNYNEVCGHEINIFLYFKFPELFNKYVKNNLKYKIEKTFIDYFLLDDYDTLYQYLTSFKINLLSTFELCLLLLKLININININKNPNEAEKIKNIIKSRTISKENLENHFITNFNTIINMSLNEEKKSIDSNKILYEEEENLNLNEEIDNMELCLNIADPDMNVFSSEDYNGFDRKKRKENYKNALKRAEKEIGAEFEKPGNVKEYQETHYFLEKYESKDINNPLWLDFAEHITKEKTHKKFLSKNILYNKDIRINEILYIL